MLVLALCECMCNVCDDPLPNSFLQLAACKLARCLMKAANQVTDHLTIEDTVIEEDLSDTYLSTIHACFNLGFEVSCGTHADFIYSMDILAMLLALGVVFSQYIINRVGHLSSICLSMTPFHHQATL